MTRVTSSDELQGKPTYTPMKINVCLDSSHVLLSHSSLQPTFLSDILIPGYIDVA